MLQVTPMPIIVPMSYDSCEEKRAEEKLEEQKEEESNKKDTNAKNKNQN